MNREIKFRAWDNKLNLMLATDSVSLCINGDICFLDTDGEWVADTENRITLLQYTGLKDKNGVEVYEGDILNSGACWGVRVEFENGTIWIKDLDKVRYSNEIICIPISKFGVNHWEVIGNIYENKELLEDK